MATPVGRLGDPISDDTSEDESSQIRGLEEDRGIYHHEEVVVPPQYESDEDRPIKGLDDVQENPQEGRHSASAPMERRPSTSQRVRFTGGPHSDDEVSSMKITKENQDMIRKLENPHSESEDDAVPPMGTSIPGYPPTSPPAYTPASPRRVMSPEPPPKVAAVSRGSVSEIMSKVTQPFASMMQRASRVDDDDSEDEPMDSAALTQEERALMDVVSEFSPEEIELKAILRPFILDYIPAIGDIDAFIKVPRPDEVEDNIGLTQLDEPAVKQSDPAILGMQMRNATREVTTTHDDAPVKQLERADQNSGEIDTWITNIKELHRTRPSQTMQYKEAMPDIDRLMQEWQPNFEQKLADIKLPTADLDVPLEEFADICLTLVDIPIGKSRINSLHLFFSLYAEFKNSQHFRSMAQNNASNSYQDNTDRLEL